ncbi:MAG: hypothetical protein AVDCRST_MAG68-1158, partial [uncultured Gemmatimonadetes bacterium]
DGQGDAGAPGGEQHHQGPGQVGHGRPADDRRPALLPQHSGRRSPRRSRRRPHQGRGVEEDRRAAGKDRPRHRL